MSEVDKWVRMALISGIHDEETKQVVLSKDEEMPLADTITFVEARETGKNLHEDIGRDQLQQPC